MSIAFDRLLSGRVSLCLGGGLRCSRHSSWVGQDPSPPNHRFYLLLTALQRRRSSLSFCLFIVVYRASLARADCLRPWTHVRVRYPAYQSNNIRLPLSRDGCLSFLVYTIEARARSG